MRTPGADRTRQWRLRKAGTLPPALQPCTTCHRQHTGRHGDQCVICWRKTPDGRDRLAALARAKRKRAGQ